MNADQLERCPSCDAPHGPDEAFCWMCHQRFWDDNAPVKRASAVPERAPGRRIPHIPQNAAAVSARDRVEDADRWSQPFLVFALLAIMTGLGLSSATGSALLWLALVPALFVTGLFGFRRPKTKPVTFGEKALAAVMLLANTVAILVLALIALVIALVAVCFAIMAITGIH